MKNRFVLEVICKNHSKDEIKVCGIKHRPKQAIERIELALNSSPLLLFHSFKVKAMKSIIVKCSQCRWFESIAVESANIYCHRVERNVPKEFGGCMQGKKKK